MQHTLPQTHLLQSCLSKCTVSHGFLSNGSHYCLGWKFPSHSCFLYTLSIHQWSVHAFFSLLPLFLHGSSWYHHVASHAWITTVASKLVSMLLAPVCLNFSPYSTLIPNKFMNLSLLFLRPLDPVPSTIIPELLHLPPKCSYNLILDYIPSAFLHPLPLLQSHSPSPITRGYTNPRPTVEVLQDFVYLPIHWFSAW